MFWLEEAGLPITGANIARAMRLSAPTVHEMIGRLERDGYVSRSDDKSLGFTEEGREHARAIVKRHRLIERFLTDVLEIPWDEVHEEAERMEHAMSPVLEERMMAAIGDATTCPHGHPIVEGVREHGSLLADCEADASVEILRFENEAEELLHYLKKTGIHPGLTGTIAPDGRGRGRAEVGRRRAPDRPRRRRDGLGPRRPGAASPRAAPGPARPLDGPIRPLARRDSRLRLIRARERPSARRRSGADGGKASDPRGAPASRGGAPGSRDRGPRPRGPTAAGRSCSGTAAAPPLPALSGRHLRLGHRRPTFDQPDWTHRSPPIVRLLRTNVRRQDKRGVNEQSRSDPAICGLCGERPR